MADIAAFLGLMSLLLMAIGIYGTLASSLAQRTREFGVRRALGASDAELIRSTLARALTPVALGVVGGLPAAAFVAQLGGAMLFGITPREPSTYIWTVAVLSVVTGLAAMIPATAATSTSVVVALRED